MADDEKTRWAIDVMTAWSHDDRSAEFMRERIDSYLTEPQGCAGLIIGLVNLSGLLLNGLEITTGQTTPEILQAIASTVSRQARSPDENSRPG